MEPVDLVCAGGGEMGALMRSIDWSATPAGPVESWPQSLRTVLGLLLASDYPIFVWWGDDLVQFYNDGYRPILGSTKHPAAMGQRGRECWKEIWDVISPMIEKVLAGGSTYTKDGLLTLDRHGFLEECYFNYAYSPIRGEADAVAGIFVACEETTRRVIGERRLKTLGALGTRVSRTVSPDEACVAAAAILSEAGSDLPFALLYLVDDDGASARLAALAGIPPSNSCAPPRQPISGAQGSIWPFSDSAEETVVDLSRLCEGLPGGPWPEAAARALVLPLEGSSRGTPQGYLVAGLSPRLMFDDSYRDFLRLVAGHIASAVQNARAAAEEKRRNEALAELDRAKTAFFSNVSHEFRTPLTLMLGPLESALSDTRHPLSPEQREWVALVHRNGQRLLKLVNSLLDFSRIGAAKMIPQRAPVDLSALTASLASAFEGPATAAGLRLVIDCPPLEGPVHADPDMWEKVVLNLVSNAFKHTFEGEIGVRFRAQGNQVELVVHDTGTGIPAAEQSKIFERFHRVENARARSNEGSGIGLSLVRELVKLHGGDVRVDSIEGAGSTFTVTMPSGETSPTPEAQAPAQPTASTREVFVEEARQWLERPAVDRFDGVASEHAGVIGRVLVADDNADMREYMARLLRSRFEVESVADGTAALHAALLRVPDAILADVMMPGLDGFELVRALRADARTAEIPVVLISARAGEEATVEGLGAGVADYIVKPFGARELVARVEGVVKAAHARAERDVLLVKANEALHRAMVSEAEAERHMREAEAARQRLVGLVQNAPAFVCTLRGPNHVFELINPPYQALVGLGRKLLGLPLREAIPEAIEQGFVAILDRVYATGEPFIAREIPITLARRPHGAVEDTWLNFTYQPRRDALGAIEGIDVFGFEVTEHIVARERAENLSSQLRLADQRKNEFLAMLAHELRNPMAAISLALTMLERTDADSDRAQATRHRQTARRQLGHLVRLVDDLLDVSRITQGKFELRKEPVDLVTVVHSALAAAGAAIDDRQHALSIRIGPGPFALTADATRLEQIVVNLLTNAAKYTDPGGELVLSLSREGEGSSGHALLSVRDSGRGIPREMIDSIFDMFVQVSPTLERSAGGLGLGLTLVKALVAMHGGTVSAASEGPGRGTEVTVRLPLAPTVTDAPTDTRDDEPASARSGSRRIVLVEDSRDVRELFQHYLEILGHSVTTSEDGLDGASKAIEMKPDVAIVDVGLPGIDGYEVARRVRQAAGGNAIVLIALTGYGGDAARRKAEEAGFDHHLVKPVDLQVLSSLLGAS